MTTPNFTTEANKAGKFPSRRFGKRERKLLKSVQEHLTSGLRVIAAGTFTTVGGDANETITVPGAAATDVVSITLKTAGVSPVTVLRAAAATDAINVVLSADPDNDHVLQYVVIRPS